MTQSDRPAARAGQTPWTWLRDRRVVGGAGVVAAYLLVTLVMTWPYVNYADFGGTTYGGDQRLIVWTLAWDNHALLTRVPLFQSNLFFPDPDSLRYNEHLFGVSLFTLPWAMAGASPVLAHNATLWLAFPLNGLAAFALIRRFVRSRLAAFAGSLAFTYSFYVMSHAHAHLQLVWLWPIALSLLLLERWFDAPSVRRIASWTAVMLLEVLTGWYIAVLVLFANALFGAVLVVFSRSGPAASQPRDQQGIWPRRLVHLLLAAVVLCLCVFPFARHYKDIIGLPGEVTANSADLASYLVPPQNSLAGRWWHAHVDERPRAIWGEQTLFAGWLSLALAAIGLVVLARDREIRSRAWFFPVLAAVACLVSFGPSLPLLGPTSLAPYSWLAALPGLDAMRAPARFAALFMLGVAGLVGIAADAVVHRFGRRGRLLVAALVPLMLLEWVVVDFPAGKPESRLVPAIYLTPEVRTARSLVSLPDYWKLTDWVLGGDYLYYSMWHWRPIVNGFGRTAPRGYDDVIATVRAFPSTAAAMRTLGIQYVVLHAGRFPDGAREMLDAARTRADCRLVRRIDSDYLFELVAP